MTDKELTGTIIAAAIKVHSALGPGLLESAYEACLVHELTKNGLSVKPQLALPIQYDGIQVDAGYRIDLLVENRVIVELKAVQDLLPIHEAQLLSYLRLSRKQIGLLINFHTMLLKDGVRRIVDKYIESVASGN